LTEKEELEQRLRIENDIKKKERLLALSRSRSRSKEAINNEKNVDNPTKV
jgi:hypothetical protein